MLGALIPVRSNREIPRRRSTPFLTSAIFWDGRANNRFNGQTPFGDRDPNAGVYLLNSSNALTVPTHISIPNASLASQAVGPPESDFEMACSSFKWRHIARKLLSNNVIFGLGTTGLNQSPRKALAGQAVSSTDSLLAPYRDASGIGLNKTYPELIRLAFPNTYWKGGDPGGPAAFLDYGGYGTNYTQMELNLSFFFGLAVQLYESTLVSDDAPIDRYLNSAGVAVGGVGSGANQLTLSEERGRILFGVKAFVPSLNNSTEQGKGRCIQCHSGPQLTGAGTPNYRDAAEGKLISQMIMGDGIVAHYDEAFYNIGVRPTIEDIGVGDSDGRGNHLSFTRQHKDNLVYGTNFVDPIFVCTSTLPDDNCPATTLSGFRTAVDGAFKTPTLRNVELTGPYFHNGSRKTLEEVVEFYNRGGDRRGSNSSNTSGFNHVLPTDNNQSNLDPDIQPLGLTAAEQADLVAFLKRPLTDDRVRCDKAPFDHPELRIPNGHSGNNVSVTGANGEATDTMLTISAVGSAGMCGANLSGARLPFDQTLAP